MSNTVNRLYLVNLFRPLHLVIAKYTFFLNAHITYKNRSSNTHSSYLNILKSIQIMQSILYNK